MTLSPDFLHTKTMINYLVKCPSDPYENTDCFNDLDRYMISVIISLKSTDM